ncbi:MAG: TetR/AcrR family transcriptional regulator [Gammaproteobacteria bacterium]|jgi:AcrR family transcriptional regulator
MAQRSKKDHIVSTALPLFLEQGFKGMSIDMVVRASGVSKPTVYNHFPDKSALMETVLRRWVEDHKPVIVTLGGIDELDVFIRKHWLSDEAVRLYAIVIGEGWRFADAKRLFWEQYDRRWRVAFGYICERSPDLDADSVARLLDERLLERLRE